MKQNNKHSSHTDSKHDKKDESVNENAQNVCAKDSPCEKEIDVQNQEKTSKSDQSIQFHELLVRLEESQKEAQEFKDKFLRSYADLENFRKRIIREKDELRQNVLENIIDELLPVIDNFQLGLNCNSTDSGKLIDGLQIVLNQLNGILNNKGVQKIHPKKGDIFDPHKHECISHIPNEELSDGQILDTIRTGYQLKERLLRPASVVVSSGCQKFDASKSSESDSLDANEGSSNEKSSNNQKE